MNQVEYRDRTVRFGHGRRQVSPSNFGIGFDPTVLDPQTHSQTQYRRGDCETDVLTHCKISQWEGMDDF